jgi:FkbM family methyltransferase
LGTLQKLHRYTSCKLISIRGRYSLTLGGHTVVFSAPTPTVVRRNRRRFSREKAELRDLLNESEEDDIVYDIGANTGLYTLFASKACPHGRVVSFEPYSPNTDILKKDIARNQLQNVDVAEIALSDSIGSTEFNQPDEADVGYGSSNIKPSRSQAAIKIPTTTGNQLISNGEIPPADIVKIDVEGSEPLVVNGMSSILSMSTCRIVYCEVHLPGADCRPSIEDFGGSPKHMRNQLEDFGFTVEELDSEAKNEIMYKGQK